MAHNPQQQQQQQQQQQLLQELGCKLDSFSSTKDALIKLLKKAASCLSDMGQSQRDSDMDSMHLFINAIVTPWVLKHQDREVRLLVATCFCEITRITAPEAPYNDDILKDIFHLIVSTISGLNDVSGPSFGRRVDILNTLATYKSCVVMLDLGCDDLVNEMFRAFFAVVSDNHPENVLTSIKTIMVVLIEESEQIHEDLLLVLLTVLGQNKNDTVTAAMQLAMDVVENSAVKLEPGIKQFLISSISGDNRAALKHIISYHEVIYNICLCAPQILSGIIPHLTGELLLDQLKTRLNAVKLVGSIFALNRSKVSEIFQPIFPEFLKRLTDKAVSVRMAVLEHAKKCLLSNAFMVEAHVIIDALCDRLLDYDENIRRQVVAVICDVACHEMTSIPVDILKLLAERLRDKSLLVRKYTVERLAEIYMIYCSRLSDASVAPIKLDWIPGKILRCLFDKDFRSDTIEFILCKSLFPANFSVADKIVHWVDAFSSFDNVEIKALEKILEKKHMLRQEMYKFLSLRIDCQGHDSPELQKKILLCFRIMSRCFTDSVVAEDNFQMLNQLKDLNVWNLFTSLLDPNNNFASSFSSRENLLKILDDKHPLHYFTSTLSLQCSYLLFNKDDVKGILHEAIVRKSAGNEQGISACMGLLLIITSSCPLLLNGVEGDLIKLLKDENEIIKEGVLRVLAKSGGSIREQLGESSSLLELLLERMCLEGTRKQAKYAVLALAAITTDDGLKSLSVLYKRLVDIMEKKTQLPAVLQCLGCIAQTAPPVFETRENEIEEFVKNKILKCSNKVDGMEKTSWSDRSELCSLKIYGIKMLTKSYLPVKDVRLRSGIDKIFGILRNILTFGEVSKDIESSLTDKAYLRLASAKSVLQLSRHWDHKIPVDIFHITIRTAETCPQLKRQFLKKVTQYSKDRILDAKYSCAFVFGILGLNKEELEEERQNFSEIVQMFQHMKTCKLPLQSEAKPQTTYPEYILPHVIHVLAHFSLSARASECKDVKILELPYRQLHFFLSALLPDEGKTESCSDIRKDTISTIVSIIRSIQSSEDAVDAGKTKNSHEISELALLITKRLAGKWDDDFQVMRSLALLPPILYKPCKKAEISEVLTEKSWLNDENIFAHFESLDVDSNKTCNPEVVENGPTLGDHEVDGNELPLGKMLKVIKSKGTKPRKVAGNVLKKLVPKMVHGTDSDDMKMHIKSKKNYGKCFSRKAKQENRKNKEDRFIETALCSVPKRQRSSFSQGAFKFSSPVMTAKGFMQPTSVNFSLATSVVHSVETEPETQNITSHQMQRPTESLLISSPPGNLSFPLYIDGSDYHRDCQSTGNIIHDPKKSDMEVSGGGAKAVRKSRSANIPVRKRKRRSISVLTQCSAVVAGNKGADLINCRIKVWWPLDKTFYDGVVKSYDPEGKKHVVIYDDGDMESLFLDKERWKPINTKPNPSQKPTPMNYSAIHVAKGKRTPRKNMKPGVKEVVKVDSRSFSEASTPCPAAAVAGIRNGSENTENEPVLSPDPVSENVRSTDDETTLSEWKGRVVGKKQLEMGEQGCV